MVIVLKIVVGRVSVQVTVRVDISMDVSVTVTVEGGGQYWCEYSLLMMMVVW